MIVRTTRRRGGATVVEVALVISVFLMFLFGLFEYCRYLLMLHVSTNAARDGARYAVVNVNRPSTFVDTDFYDGARTFQSVVRYTSMRLATNDKMMKSATPTPFKDTAGNPAGTTQCQVEVFPCDPAQLNLTPPQVAPKPGFPATVLWNQASFGERIAVRLTGTYVPVLPNFLLMGTTIPMSVSVTAGSEG